MPEFDTTISITSLLAICAIISPIFVAILNNFHSLKLKKMELEQELQYKKIEIIYQEKKKAYMNLESTAGDFLSNPKSIDKYAQLISAINTCALFCPILLFSELNTFRTLATDMHKGESKGDTHSEYYKYVDLLSGLSFKLNKELSTDSKAYSKNSI